MKTKLFTELGLSPELLKAIEKLGFEQASPIQAEAIPILMAGRDVVGQSQTGSGKTAAFAIPAIEKTDPQVRAVQSLILCPTRELAVQVSEEIYKLASFKRGVHELPIYGGQSYERQFQGLRQGAQIVIGTPGRVMDHMRRGTLRLDKVKMVILDEADVMLDMGFREDIETILQGVPKERQTVFFSATIPRPIQELVQKYSREPQMVRLEQKALTVPTVEQVYYEVDRRSKLELLTRLIDLHDLKLGIIFCNTKRMVDDLVEHLNAQGYSADRLHGDMSQSMRDRVMNRFRKSGLEFLVATDVAARGIDVENVQVVFNYDLPYDAEDYLHRIGRTGRAGRSGWAVSFAAGREVFQIQQIERFIKVKMQRGKPPTAQEVDEARANVFLDKIRTTLRSEGFKAREPLVERLLEEGFASTDVAAALLHLLQASEGSTTGRVTEDGGGPRGLREWRAERGECGDRGERKGRRERGGRGSFERPQAGSDRGKLGESRGEGIGARPPENEPRSRKARQPTEKSEVSAPASAPEVDQQGVRTAESKEAHTETATEATAGVQQRRVPFPERRGATESPTKLPKQSRRTPDEQTRLYMNVGQQMGLVPADVVSTILGETGLPPQVVGAVDIRERHLFVDVATEHSNAIISKLNRARIKEHKLKVKVA